MRACVYPAEKHRRTQRPGAFTDYRQFKSFLRDEFGTICVYCRLAEGLNGRSDNYGVEHYRPKCLFPDLCCTYTNLFYCCNGCNRRKGDYWPSRKDRTTRFIPNPCDHAMSVHLRVRDTRVQSRTPAGEQAVFKLDLNDPGLRQLRSSAQLQTDALLELIKRNQENLKKIRKRKDVEYQKKEAAIKKLQSLISKAEEQLRFVVGVR